MTVTPEFIKSFVTTNNIPFASTQPRLCVPIVIRICKKMLRGIKFEEIKVFEGMIIDGHHRYLSALMTGVEIGQIPTHKTSATKVFGWENVQLDEYDWDTPAKIAHLNEIDARYNDLELEFVKSITLGK